MIKPLKYCPRKVSGDYLTNNCNAVLESLMGEEKFLKMLEVEKFAKLMNMKQELRNMNREKRKQDMKVSLQHVKPKKRKEIF